MSDPTNSSQPTDQAAPSSLNVPNALTAFRLVLVPVFAIVLLSHPHDSLWRVLSAAIFGVAIFTDFLDGHLARKHNIVTTFGKLADPIADKALTGMAFIGLSVIGELWWWVTIVILIREWGITLLRFLVLRYGVMSARKGGKIKTVLQAVALALLLLPLPGPLLWVGWIVMAVAFVFTVVTGVDYVLEANRVRKTALARQESESSPAEGPASRPERKDRDD